MQLTRRSSTETNSVQSLKAFQAEKQIFETLTLLSAPSERKRLVHLFESDIHIRRLTFPLARSLQDDEILETLEVSNDARTSKAIKEGLKDIRTGKVRPYRDFVRELRGSHEL